MTELRRLLETPRLVTLVGPGGIGKARPAIEAGRARSWEYVDGLALPELSALSGPSSVPHIIADFYGVS